MEKVRRKPFRTVRGDKHLDWDNGSGNGLKIPTGLVTDEIWMVEEAEESQLSPVFINGMK